MARSHTIPTLSRDAFKDSPLVRGVRTALQTFVGITLLNLAAQVVGAGSFMVGVENWVGFLDHAAVDALAAMLVSVGQNSLEDKGSLPTLGSRAND